jgi:magnesium chelatase subunit D
VPQGLLRHVAARIAEHDVRTLRADLAVVRASTAYAALQAADEVTSDHVETVLPLALAHRAHVRRPPRPRSPVQQPDNERRAAGGSPAAAEPPDRVFEPAPLQAPRVLLEGRSENAGTSAAGSAATGPVVASRPAADPRELDLRTSIVHTVVNTGSPDLRRDDLHERMRARRAGSRYIFIVDSSGSHAVQARMRLVKGAVTGLLYASHQRGDEVVVISCRGAAAEVLVEPTSSKDDAERALEYLPTGGRTPLAHALELAAGYVTDHAVVIVVTDGHANVPHR